MLSRQALRRQERSYRHTLSDKAREIAAIALAECLSQHAHYKNSRHIAFYIANDGELDPCYILKKAWEDGKICYLPVLEPEGRNQLNFAPYAENEELIPNRFGIPEPIVNAEKLIAAKDLDLVCLPLVACDKQGNRLGMGSGYYDRSFAFLKQLARPSKPILMGIAFTHQIVDRVPNETWDIPIDGIATNEGIEIITGP